MINREVIYERDINKSYMKIAAIAEENLDEKIMLKKTFHGFLPVEKSFVNQKGQYWYNISGKQALDVYCRVNTIGRSFFEGLILRICNQLELLEWHLLDPNCMTVDPELIFLDSSGEEFSFVLYPQRTNNFFQELQMLMEYLLPKLDHGDKEAVKSAYKIYELSLVEGCSISDLKEAILSSREKEIEPQVYSERIREVASYEATAEEPAVEKIDGFEKKLAELFQKAREILKSKPEDLWKIKGKSEETPMVVYPEEEEKPIEVHTHPTVCIASASWEPKGVLLYEGNSGYPDFELEKSVCAIGKSHKVKYRIDKETISQFHAKIDFFDNDYYIEDMNSTNGTFLNEEMLSYKDKRQLHPGDVVRFADVKYRFL